MDLTGHLGERCLSPVANTAARVHVVDDDPYVRSSLGRLLSVKGYQVSVHDSADAYLRDPDAFEWGCLVLDVAMPGLNGLELQDALRERQAQKPIIFLTGRGDVPMCARAMKRGAVEFLTKPVDAALLIEAVERALDRDTAMREESALRADAQTRRRAWQRSPYAKDRCSRKWCAVASTSRSRPTSARPKKP